jgi:hypothetical protein
MMIRCMPSICGLLIEMTLIYIEKHNYFYGNYVIYLCMNR